MLRPKTPDGVLHEISGFPSVRYALRSIVGEVARDLDEDPLSMSLPRTLRAAGRTLAARPAFPRRNMPTCSLILCREILHEPFPARRQLSNPRVAKRNVSGCPRTCSQKV